MVKKTIYYTDELKDDFSGITRKTKVIDEKYMYIRRNPVWRFFEFVVYRLLIVPFAFVYVKIKFNHKVIGKTKLRKIRGGYFIYANHTLMAGDAFIPNVINMPKKTFTVVHPDNVSVSSTRWLIEMCGALPLPSTITAMRNFMNALDVRSKKCAIQIYPEAHVWPYYTGIRDFKSTSLRYPIIFDKPIFVLTNTFRKKRLGKVPRVVTYIDGPFYPNKDLMRNEQEEELKKVVRGTMIERVKNSNYKYYEYIKENIND